MTVAAVELPAPQHLPMLGQPRTRGDCLAAPRPCAWRACRHNLLGEKKRPAGGPSCALDIADAGGATLDVIGKALGVSRERVRQIQKRAVESFAEGLRQAGVITSREAWRVPAAVRELLTK